MDFSEDPFGKGFEIGCVVCFLATVVAFSWMNFKTMDKVPQKRRKTKKQNYPKLLAVDNLQRGNTTLFGLEKMVTRFSYNDLRNATNNFHERNIIGMGNIGIVFKAMLPGGIHLAVKKLHYHPSLDEQFIFELKTLGTLTHTNLLPLVGFCINPKERLLVYKYMPNGRLYDWLIDKSKVLDWTVRAKIAVGLARGLAWLHKGGHVRVIHLNVNSKCILLDHDFEPRLSNFEEAMLITPSSNACLNPKFWESVFVKDDVYSFGVVLLELITGEDSSYHSQSEWIGCLQGKNSSTSHDLVDKSIVKQDIGNEMYAFIDIAFDCVQSIPEDRPTMQQVYWKITNLGERHNLFDACESLGTNETSNLSQKGKSVETEIDET